jgi:hypothetical protein
MTEPLQSAKSAAGQQFGKTLRQNGPGASR